MSAHRTLIEELNDLADAHFDGTISTAGVHRIEALILADPRLLQAYVERLDFHCELIEQAESRSQELVALTALQASANQIVRRQSRRSVKRFLGFAVCVCLVISAILWADRKELFLRTPVGSVASLSSDYTSSSRPFVLGQTIRARQRINVQSGVVSLQLSGVFVDVVGPASAYVARDGLVILKHGTIISKVQPQSTGFTVRTPETEVVDLGTEFLVKHDAAKGSHVSVRTGSAQAKQLDWTGQSTRIFDLSSFRAAQFSATSSIAKEVAYSPEMYASVDRNRRGIQRLTGEIRTTPNEAKSLASENTTTPNHVLILPEKSITLSQPLTVNSLKGSVSFPTGTTLTSYLVHYDPTSNVQFAPRGSVTFHRPISAVLYDAETLNHSDALFGSEQTIYEKNSFRELELDEDEILISDDQRTLSFFLGISPPAFLDEMRVLIVE
ncbi:FecR domain-containing protein [Planctomicrobium sp. SH668]|uniref:FecR domain-containing protein n=1 Tax=Planctomicrobium sp. SH668 TaxID=3448126 RepID=UPI003F5BCF68